MSDISMPDPGNQLRSQIKKYVMGMMGSPVTKVEITEAQCDLAIDNALALFCEWVSDTTSTTYFQTIPNQNTYKLSDLAPGYLAVQEVIYSSSATHNLLLGGFLTDFAFGGGQSSYAGGYGMGGGSSGLGFSVSEFYVMSMYKDMVLRQLGLAGTWQTYGNTLVLNQTPVVANVAAIIYTKYPEIGDIRRLSWLKEYALADVQIMVGRSRSKYSTIPGPRGEITMDGASLISEGTESKKNLMVRLNEYYMPISITTG